MEFIARNPELSKIAKDLVEYGFNRGIIELRKYNYISPTGCIGLCAHINTGKEKDMKNGVDFYITNNTNQTIEEYMAKNNKETILNEITDSILYCRDTEERSMYLTELLLKYLEETKTYGRNGLKI